MRNILEYIKTLITEATDVVTLNKIYNDFLNGLVEEHNQFEMMELLEVDKEYKTKKFALDPEDKTPLRARTQPIETEKTATPSSGLPVVAATTSDVISAACTTRRSELEKNPPSAIDGATEQTSLLTEHRSSSRNLNAFGFAAGLPESAIAQQAVQEGKDGCPSCVIS